MTVFNLGVKNFLEIALCCKVSEINVFFAIYAEIQNEKQIWGKKCHMSVCMPCIEIAERLNIFHFRCSEKLWCLVNC